ncbi:GntR family transcriptional regulator [Salipiger marinus]|uniref:DNA-binding transcriptional regulator, GntR family n=1 Tax=Salipiger marinus TaxID=555512 RepID=A0A1G8QU14_9RHOB|nr:GntR family transcriptional regulator [Salipiger marinus]SDJ08197.1 DNA-binding transcriptional regulator, GntR family [Salipiger marinus]
MRNRQPQKADQIYGILRRAIVMLEMAPGSPIVEKEVCSAYNVSRTPVREAVQKLAEEGLVNVIPHSGTYVSQISYAGAEEGFLIRRALEVEGVRRAAARADVDPEALADLDRITAEMQQMIANGQLDTYIDADDALHGTVARMSGMTRLWKFVSMAKVDLDRMRQLSAPVPGHLARVTEQHIQIVEAIRRGKPDQAELAMRIHLDSSFTVMSSLIRDSHGIFVEEAAR